MISLTTVIKIFIKNLFEAPPDLNIVHIVFWFVEFWAYLNPPATPKLFHPKNRIQKILDYFLDISHLCEIKRDRSATV